MQTFFKFLTRRRGDFTDWISYAYLILGLVVMFTPILWLVVSSFKNQASIATYPPTLLPKKLTSVQLEGISRPLDLYTATLEDGTKKILALEQIAGIRVTLRDPENPSDVYKLNKADIKPIEEVYFAFENYTEPLSGRLSNFKFLRYFFNSTFVTVIATLITLLINSMAAFGLSKYRFRGRSFFMFFIVCTLMIPPTVILVPLFLMVQSIGLFNSLWGVIVPGAATPTGVFLLRQYMLTLPDELLEAARMDYASEWKIYWRIVLPLTLPALAVLGILSIIWRWNDFLWPLINLQNSEVYTLQLALNSFRGEFDVQWHYLLSMTVLTLLPVTAVFAFLQRFISTGIANTGIK